MKSKFPLLMLLVLLNIIFSHALNLDSFCFESFNSDIPQLELETFHSSHTLDKIALKKISSIVQKVCPQYFIKKEGPSDFLTQVLFKPTYGVFIASSYLRSGAEIFQEISSHA